VTGATQKSSSASPEPREESSSRCASGATDRSCHAEQVGLGANKKMGKVPDKKDTESSASDEESERAGGSGWPSVSTMKGGPPKRHQVCDGLSQYSKGCGR